MNIKKIYITHEEGLNEITPIVEDALNDLLNCFPNYKNLFPITNLGNWKDNNHSTIENNGTVLNAYKSIDWYIARSKLQSKLDGRWENKKQLNVNTLTQDLWNDPYAKKIPQLSLLIVKEDLYGKLENGSLLNFCLGSSIKDRFTIISTSRFLDKNNNLKKEKFKTVIMHEFGHIINLTNDNRDNIEENLGPHCKDKLCIMQQDATGSFEEITQARLLCKENELPSICPDCIKEGEKYFEKQLQLFKEQNKHFEKDR